MYCDQTVDGGSNVLLYICAIITFKGFFTIINGYKENTLQGKLCKMGMLNEAILYYLLSFMQSTSHILATFRLI